MDSRHSGGRVAWRATSLPAVVANVDIWSAANRLKQRGSSICSAVARIVRGLISRRGGASSRRDEFLSQSGSFGPLLELRAEERGRFGPALAVSFSYGIAVSTETKSALTFWPAPRTAATHRIEMRPASSAYSIRS